MMGYKRIYFDKKGKYLFVPFLVCFLVLFILLSSSTYAYGADSGDICNDTADTGVGSVLGSDDSSTTNGSSPRSCLENKSSNDSLGSDSDFGFIVDSELDLVLDDNVNVSSLI